MDLATRHHLAQSLSAIENRSGEWRRVLAESYRKRRDLFIIGITGPPGSGKSTLIDSLAAHWAGLGLTIGILAIDPSSPFSGGAILGDRLRMHRSEDLSNVFIRSLSARGHPGGVNASALDLATVMAAHGCSHVLLETVGSGQSEVDIGFIADCTIVVAVPGLGDSVQAAKAGLMEIGDLYVVNKSDLPHAQAVRQDLASMLAVAFRGKPGRNDPAAAKDIRPRAIGAMPKALSERYGDPDNNEACWHPPVLAASASRPELVAEIVGAIEGFRQWLQASDHCQRRQTRALSAHVLDIAKERLFSELSLSLHHCLGRPFEEWAGEQLTNGTKDPHRLADMMMALVDKARGQGIKRLKP